MPTGNPGAIFFGRVPSSQRAYVGKLLGLLKGAGYTKLVAPCVGAFTVPEIAVRNGWRAQDIACSDISLYTSVIGYAVTGRSVGDLGVEASPELPLPPGFKIDSFGAVLYALKFAQQYQQNAAHKMNAFEMQFFEDLRRRPAEHVAAMDAKVAAYAASLSGVRYEPRDVFDHLDEVKDDEKTVVVCAMPFYSGDYDKLYDTGGRLRWDEPGYAFYDPKDDYPKMVEVMDRHAGIAFWYWWKPDGKDLERAVFGHHVGGGRVECLLTSRPDVVRGLMDVHVTEKRMPPSESAGLPVLPPEHEVTDKSVLSFTPCTGPQAMYYRDLFVHRMGSTSSERTYLLLLDGYVFAVVGLNNMRFNTGVQDHLEETFGIATTNRKWRIGRLLAHTLICREFLNGVVDWKVRRRAAGLAHTVWSRNPEDKANRGSFKLIDRVFDKKRNVYKLRYYGKAREVTLKQTLEKWLAAELAYRAQQGKEEDDRAVA